MAENHNNDESTGGRKGFVVIVSGASGAGKGSVINEISSMRDDYVLSISTTTRAPRGEGVVGEHYQHVSEEVFPQPLHVSS